MQLTNTLGLPQPIVDAVSKHGHDIGDSDISITQLIDSPQVFKLARKHDDELTEDVSMRIWALFGSAIHEILDKLDNNPVPAKRMVMPYTYKGRTFRISGLPDRLVLIEQADGYLLQDYKTATTWEHIYGMKPARQQQVNLYRWLIEQELAKPVVKMEIVSLFKDWSPGQLARNADYPRVPVQVYPVRPWTLSETGAFIDQRLQRHFFDPAYCDDEERWVKPGKYVVRKEGRITALRNLDSYQEAYDWADDHGYTTLDGELKNGISIIKTVDQHRRCMDNGSGHSYCPVSKFCPQWAAINGTQEAAE